MDVLKELQLIFQDVFDDDSLAVTKEMSASDVEDWDSLAQIRLIVAIEKQFKVKIPAQEWQNLANIGDMVALIERKLTMER